MKCPICASELQEEKSDLYPNYPTYRCLSGLDHLGDAHYLKYFSADWSYSRYEERATIHPYRIINYHNYRVGKKSLGCIQHYESIPITGSMYPTHRYRNLVIVDDVIPIPPRDKFIQKLKTLILLS